MNLNLEMNKRQKRIALSISFICLVCFIVLNLITIINGIYHLKPSKETNNAVDYENLRRLLSIPGSYHVFLTQHTSIFFTFVGTLYYFYRNNNIFKNIFFVTISFLIFNFFAMTHFRWETVKIEPYFSFQTLLVHLIFPLLAFIFLLLIRKEIILMWTPLIICSFYLTLFYLMLICIYYSFPYVNSAGEKDHLKVYEFFDFDKKIIIFSTKNIFSKIFVNLFLIILSPFISFFCFTIFKFLYGVKIVKISKWKTELAFYKNYSSY